ncbi:hypothetical protein [Rhizobium oryzicola]|uniref:MarR family transcriptional regulator n=1 Tax=Rhizobium oryzicola TaxID=1232668 RepID=A0ABT8SXL4_9HYPH|nr:hypothetical protein [Rhizobium oryzicola]MDO1583202.1 hypothetical protein [Rhizobium oryzicola]
MLSYEDIIFHPRFPDARRVYVHEMLKAHENNAKENQIFFDEGKAFVYFAIMNYYCAHDPEDRTSWPSMRMIKQNLEQLGLASGRRVHDIIRRLIDVGYVESSLVEKDRRTKLLRPTQTMIDRDLKTMVVYYAPLHVMFPDPGYPEPMSGDLAFQRGARQIGASFMAYARSFMAANPTIAFFFPRLAGMMILTKLIELSITCDGQTASRISFANIGDSFGISRTHVRKLLSEAQEHGLAELYGQHVILSPECRKGFDRYLADTMVGNDLVYRLWKQQQFDA